MTNLPAGVLYATVQGQLALAVGDEADANVLPNQVAAQGTVKFTPDVDRINLPADDLVLFLKPITCLLDSSGNLIGPDGTSAGVTLVASNTPANPSSFSYTIEISIVGSKRFSFSAMLLAGATYDLSAIAPSAASDGMSQPSLQSLMAAAVDAMNAAIAARDDAVGALSNPTYSSMVYDGDGNLTSWIESGVSCSATYNADGSIATLTTGIVTRAFSYDGAGNLTGVS